MRGIALLLLALIIALSPVDAFAYIGPGSGLSAIGSLLALVVAVLLALVGFVWFPVKRLLRLRKVKKVETDNEQEKV